jgi:hypothetical protein
MALKYHAWTVITIVSHSIFWLGCDWWVIRSIAHWIGRTWDKPWFIDEFSCPALRSYLDQDSPKWIFCTIVNSDCFYFSTWNELISERYDWIYGDSQNVHCGFPSTHPNLVLNYGLIGVWFIQWLSFMTKCRQDHSHMLENPVVDEIASMDETANTRKI